MYAPLRAPLARRNLPWVGVGAARMVVTVARVVDLTGIVRVFVVMVVAIALIKSVSVLEVVKIPVDVTV